MVTPNLEKKTRKRKRDSNIAPDEESTPLKDTPSKSPDQKSAKKKRKSDKNESLLDDSFQTEVAKVKKNTKIGLEEQEENDSLTTEKGSAKKKGKRIPKQDEDQSNEELKAINDPSSSKKEKKKKEKEIEKQSSPSKDVSETNEPTPKKKKKSKEEQETSPITELKADKKKKKQKNNTEESSLPLSEVNNVSKSEKKKKKKSPFGVVDSKLVENSGGDASTEDEKPRAASGINEAVDYLHLWKNDRQSWKFHKRSQILLSKAVYNPIIIPDDDFETLLLYFQDSKGNVRDKLKEDAMALINEDDHLAEPADPDKEKRARAVLQMLG